MRNTPRAKRAPCEALPYFVGRRGTPSRVKGYGYHENQKIQGSSSSEGVISKSALQKEFLLFSVFYIEIFLFLIIISLNLNHKIFHAKQFARREFKRFIDFPSQPCFAG
jgi:hypothetical protein